MGTHLSIIVHRLLEVDEQRRRAEEDKMAAIRELESRSVEFMREKEEKRALEQVGHSRGDISNTSLAPLLETLLVHWYAVLLLTTLLNNITF